MEKAPTMEEYLVLVGKTWKRVTAYNHQDAITRAGIRSKKAFPKKRGKARMFGED